MSRTAEEVNRRLLRARDAMDRAYPEAIDVAALAAIACVTPAHFARSFRTAFGESPHRYLQRRRVERAMYLLRSTELGVTEVCLEVGFSSLGTFSRTFHRIVGKSPSGYRKRARAEASREPAPVPTCFAMAWGRPSSFGEAPPPGAR